MYIYKTVFGNLNEFTEEELEHLKGTNVIAETDYGTTEILSESVKLENLVELGGEDEAKEIIDILNDRLGTDVVEALQKEEIDFVIMVWD